MSMEVAEIEARAEALALELSKLPGTYREAQGMGPRQRWQVVACGTDEQHNSPRREIRRTDGFTIAMSLESWPRPAKWRFRLSWPTEWLLELGQLQISNRGPTIGTKAALERPAVYVARQVATKVVGPGQAQWRAVTAQWEEHQDAKRRAESASVQLAAIGGFGWTEIRNNANHQGEERFLQYHSQTSPLWVSVRLGGWKEDGSCELELRRLPFALTLEIVALIRAHEEGKTHAQA